MIIRIQIDPMELLSIIHYMRMNLSCAFTGSCTRDGVSVPVVGTIIATHPETCSFSMWTHSEMKHVAQ